MSTRNKLAILPKLNNRGGDVSKQWFVYFSYRNPRTGKMEEKRHYAGFASRTSASAKRRWAKKLIDEYSKKLKAGWTPADDDDVVYDDSIIYEAVAEQYGRKRKSNRNFRYYASLFLSKKKNVISKSTYQTYQSKFRVFEKWLRNNQALDDDISVIDESVMRSFINYLVNDHLNEKNKATGISNGMVNYYINTLNGVFEMVRKERKGYINPLADIERLKHEHKPSAAYSPSMIDKVREYAVKYDPQMWTIILFVYATFVRPKELRYLQVKHIDFFQARLLVPGNIAKNRKTRRPQIPEYFLEYLKKMEIDKAPQDYYVISVDKQPGLKPVGKNYMWNHFEKIRKYYDIPRDYKFYGFKHTGAADLDRAGVSVKAIQQQIAHHSLDETDKYLQSLRDKQDETIQNHKPGWF